MSLRFVTSPGGALGANSSNFSRASYITGAVPVIVPSTGAGVSAVGLVTGLTALNVTSGNCWGVLPAGYLSAAGAGSAAGVYFGQVQSATSILFFNNLLVGINNSFATPASPTAFAGLAGGTFTQVTTVQTAITVTLPGNTMGPNGALMFATGLSNNNSAGAKTLVFFFGSRTASNISNTTNQSQSNLREIFNSGVTNAQVVYPSTGFGASSPAVPLLGTVDTTAAVSLIVQLQVAVATDTCQLDFLKYDVYPG